MTTHAVNASIATWDNPFLKACAVIPFVGEIIQCAAFPVIKQQMDRATNRDNPVNATKTVQLIELKNDYLRAAIVRNLLISAFLIMVAVSGIFAEFIVPLALLAGLFSACAAGGFSNLMYNKEMLAEIAESGVRPGLIN